MKDKFKNFIMNPWTISLGSGLVVLLVTVVIDVIDVFTAEKIFSTIKKILVAIRAALLYFLYLEIKVWWLSVGIAILILTLWIWTKRLDSKQSAPAEPKFLEYTQDIILEYRWKWTWKKDYFGKYSIDQLHPICAHCGTPLVDSQSGYGGRYTCLRCKNGTNRPLPDFKHVKIMISDNVRRRYFPND